MHTLTISSIAIFFYLLATGFMIQRVRQRLSSPASKWRALGIGLVAALFHAWLLYEFVITDNGINLNFFNTVSLITWFICLLLLVSAIRQPTENITLIVFPAGALAIALEQLVSGGQSAQQWESALQVHIIISILAYSLLSIAAIQAILLAIQDKHLRNKQPGGFIRNLPPLQTMETLLFQMIIAGFALQTISLVTGFMFLENMFAQHLVHKTALSLVAWLFFGVLLWGRWRFGWRGRTAIRWTISGFISLALSYIGSKMVLELILERA